MPESVNERLASEAVRHAVYFDRYSNGVVRRIIALLNRVDKDLGSQLIAALERMPQGSFSVDRLESLLSSVRELNRQAYMSVDAELTRELREYTAYEVGYQHQLFESVLPVQVSFARVSAEQVFSAAYSQPFRGKLLKEWASKIEADRMVRIRDTIRIGFVEGQTTSQIVQRIIGTRAKGYEDGVIEIDRRNARAVVQTALSHTAGVTRDRFYSENSDLVKATAWLSTIDSKTSEICIIRDKKQYTVKEHKPIGHKIPWLAGPGRAHWCCRSTSTPVTRSWKELGIDLPEVDAGTRASMDGQIAADISYGEWLKKQPAGRQDDVLGPTRGKLLRSGELTVDRFFNDRGKYLTLDELRARDAAAFAKAGL
jgi:hypothetical protein